MIQVEAITKYFDTVKAVDTISFSIPDATIFGILGPNGAGKTTTIRMLLNIIQPDTGKIKINGQSNIGINRLNIGYLPEERGLYQKSNVNDVIEYFGALKGVSRPIIKDRVQYWLNRLEMENVKSMKIAELSKGNQQKIQFITTLVSNPDILILDEPFSGLDPVNQKLMKDIIFELNSMGKTILLSTHQMSQVEQLCSEIVLIDKGKIVLNGSLKTIKRSYGTDRVKISFTNPPAVFVEKLLNEQTYQDGVLLGRLPSDKKLKGLLTHLLKHYDIDQFSHYEPSLEEIFIYHVKGADNE